MCYDYNLVQCGENVQKQPNFICNCCKCHCEAFVSAKKFGFLVPVNTTSYLPNIDKDNCVGCGKCSKVCPMEAIKLKETSLGNHNFKIAELSENLCLGCGVCVKNCKTNAIKLVHRKESVITPVTTVHRAVVSAIEKGQLQNLIFDNNAHLSHKAMAAILGSILKLPPLKKAMASKQMKSVYLAKLLENT